MKQTLLTFSILIFIQCDLLKSDEDRIDDCKDHQDVCEFETAPSKGELKVEVNINNLNTSVIVEIYRGNVDDGTLLFTDTLHSTSKTYRIENGFYSGVAKYKENIDGQIVDLFSIDGEDLDYSKKDSCEGECYEEGSIILELD